MKVSEVDLEKAELMVVLHIGGKDYTPAMNEVDTERVMKLIAESVHWLYEIDVNAELKFTGGVAKDFYGKEIKAGDTIELRVDAFDKSSCFEKGVVKRDSDGKLSLWRTRVVERQRGALEREYYYTPLSVLEMSNDIVKVES